MRVRVGTRASGLARAHSGLVTDRLWNVGTQLGKEVELAVIPVTAEGDSRHGRSEAVDRGVFVAALRVALLSGECDIVVHALEDVPMGEHPDLTIGAITARGDPRDALCTGGPLLAGLGPGARVAADSPRRFAQVLALRPDLEAVEIAGSLDYQFEKLHGGDCEGLIVGKADLDALGRPHSAVEVFEPGDVVPGPGQGVLAVEMRANASDELREVVAALDDAATRAAIVAERAVLEVLGGDKRAPMAAFATVAGDSLRLHVRALNRSGTLALNDFSEAPPSDARTLGRNAALALLGRGAARLMAS